MKNRILFSALALAIAGSAQAGDLDQELKLAMQAKDAASLAGDAKAAGWRQIDSATVEKKLANGSTVQVSFGTDGFQRDLELRLQQIDRIRQARDQATDPAEIAALERSLKNSERSMASLEQAMANQSSKFYDETSAFGSLNGCSANVDLYSNFSAQYAGYDAGTAQIEAQTNEFGPYGPGAGFVSITARADNMVDPKEAFMGGLMRISAQASVSLVFGCELETTASIVPACSVSGYRNVRWRTTCFDTAYGHAPQETYSRYRLGNGGPIR
ncbi:MAG: hypothetical protein KDI71_09605 [Xanthomonadales bacterium]|nr:hypothetical protein [Xanthomonadales bacterium]